jgi:predicted aldo/keto reductase-like oxidoreductase
METRRLGRTEHHSSIAIFGAAIYWEIDQVGADAILDQALEYGVNHFDVAPSYGQAEERLGPRLPGVRERVFLGCKSQERSREGAAAELRNSLKRLRADHFDLYQLHAVTTMAALDAITAPGGALEAVVEAQKAGLTRFIGITGHGVDAPAIFSEALRRFDFDTVMFPINFIQYADPTFRRNCEDLLETCLVKDVGVMIIKSVTRAPWGERERTHTTWYEPFNEAGHIQQAVNFVLSQKVTGLCTAGDAKVFPIQLQACANYTPLSMAEQEALIASAGQFEPLFAPGVEA